MWKYSLPQVEIPKCKRVAEGLTARPKENWRVEAIYVFNPACSYCKHVARGSESQRFSTPSIRFWK